MTKIKWKDKKQVKAYIEESKSEEDVLFNNLLLQLKVPRVEMSHRWDNPETHGESLIIGEEGRVIRESITNWSGELKWTKKIWINPLDPNSRFPSQGRLIGCIKSSKFSPYARMGWSPLVIGNKRIIYGGPIEPDNYKINYATTLPTILSFVELPKGEINRFSR